MLLLKPHTATIYPAVADSSSVAEGYSRAASSGTVRGHLVRQRADQMLSDLGLSTDATGLWMQDVGAAALVPGTHIVVDGERYAVTTVKVVRNADTATSHEIYQVQKL